MNENAPIEAKCPQCGTWTADPSLICPGCGREFSEHEIVELRGPVLDRAGFALALRPQGQG